MGSAGCGTAIPITTSDRRVPGGGREQTSRLDQRAEVTGSNLACVRDHNQLLVFHAIRTRGASTRRDLSKLTGLTFQTIENISRRLIEAGILEDVPPPTTGRPRQLVLRPAGAYAVGIEAVQEGWRVALCDLEGRALAEQQLALGTTSLASSLDELALVVQDLIDDAEVPITTVVAVGLAAPSSPAAAPMVTGLQRGAPSGDANGCATAWSGGYRCLSCAPVRSSLQRGESSGPVGSPPGTSSTCISRRRSGAPLSVMVSSVPGREAVAATSRTRPP